MSPDEQITFGFLRRAFSVENFPELHRITPGQDFQATPATVCELERVEAELALMIQSVQQWKWLCGHSVAIGIPIK